MTIPPHLDSSSREISVSHERSVGDPGDGGNGDGGNGGSHGGEWLWPGGRRWQKPIRIGLAIFAVAALAGAFAVIRHDWDLRHYELARGSTSTSRGSVMEYAGMATGFCFKAVPDATPMFGFSIMNPGSRTVTITSVEPMFGVVPQSITIDKETNGSEDGPDTAIAWTPVTIPAYQERLFYVTFHMPPAGDTLFRSDKMITDQVRLRIRIGGLARVISVPLGEPDSPTYVTLAGGHGKCGQQ